MFSFTTVSFSECSAAISSSTGPTILQGPHHSAQKSTSTGLSLVRTSSTNVTSVTVFVLVPTLPPCGAGSACVTPGRGDGFPPPPPTSAGQRRVRGSDPRRPFGQRGEVTLRVQCGRTARSGGGDRLPVGVVDDVA